MTPAEHRVEADRLVRLCYTAEPMVPDEVLPDITISGGERYANMLAAALVHATLALAPTPPPPVQPQHKWSLDKPHTFPDATGGQVTVLPVKGAPGVILSFADDAALLENPDVLRTLASLLTAHADRLEPKP